MEKGSSLAPLLACCWLAGCTGSLPVLGVLAGWLAGCFLWGVVLIILVIIVIIFVNIDSSSGKSSHQQRPAGLLPSFCCWNCQF